VVAGRENDDKIVLTADSDAILTKGIIAILIRTFQIKALLFSKPIWIL
jgi:sulfur transfer protein SufE